MFSIGRNILIASLLAVFAISGNVTAHPAKVTAYPYVETDLGTLGGPSSQVGSGAKLIADGGAVLVQTADTRVLDPDWRKAGAFDSHISHAAVWRNGKLTDLGALHGNNDSLIIDLNRQGVGAGLSESGAIDPLLGGTAIQAIVWKGGKITKIPTLGGRESVAASINNSGQVAGFTTNRVRDRWSGSLDTVGPTGTQARAFLWTKAHGIKSLGTLGGPDSSADLVNSHGQVDGVSFTNGAANIGTGKPTEHPFLWSKKTGMRDLGTLGGTEAFPSEEGITMNDRGEVVGQSNLAGDYAFHPFLWTGSKMIDLGTFGGTYGAANTLNQAGDVVGFAQVTAGGTCRAFLWKKGKKINLGVIPGASSSSAFSVNVHDDVVGGVCYDGGSPVAWLWHKGKMHNLQKLVAPSALHLTAACYIADNGQIVATANLPNGHQHVVLLTPAGSR